MNIRTLSEQRFQVCPDGSVWTPSCFDAEFWRQYLDVFERVIVVARLRPVPEPSAKWIRADDQSIEFEPIPYYHGPEQFVRVFFKVQLALQRSMKNRDALIFRVPSNPLNWVFKSLVRQGRPYGVEVVGDPYDVFAPGAVRHPLRPFFRWWYTSCMKAQCASACANAYVTGKSLQKRYPPQRSVASRTSLGISPWERAATRTVQVYSNVGLASDAYASPLTTAALSSRKWDVVFVGLLDQQYKGLDVLLHALRLCKERGSKANACIVGSGKFESKYRRQAAHLGLGKSVHFAGHVPGPLAVRQFLDQSRLFVLPSLAEGMPRALLEAMARGLPCIVSSVGGVPEVLSGEALVPTNDAQTLAKRIMVFLSSPHRLVEHSTRNRGKATEFAEDQMQWRRNLFLNAVKEATEDWIRLSGVTQSLCEVRVPKAK